MKRMILPILVVMAITLLPGVQGYMINGDSVYVDDSNARISAYPHTITQSGWVYLDFTPKLFTGQIDAYFGFDTTTTKPNKLEYWNGANWIDISQTFEPEEFTFDGKNKWYSRKGINVNAGQEYQIRIWLNIAGQGKWDFAIKRTQDTIEEAINNNRFYLLDPWWNESQYMSLVYNSSHDTGSGTVAVDSSSYGNNGTFAAASNDPSWNTSGYNASGIYFDGDDYYSIPHSSENSISTTGSWMAWIKTDVGGAYQYIFDKYHSVASNETWRMYLTNGATAAPVCAARNASAYVTATGSTVLTKGIWTHVACIYNSSHLNIYVNGELEAQASLTGGLRTTTANIMIGATNPVTPTQGMQGVLDNVMIFNTSLTYTELQAIYNGSGLYNPLSLSPTTAIHTPIAAATYYDGSIILNYSVSDSDNSTLTSYIYTDGTLYTIETTDNTSYFTHSLLFEHGTHNITVATWDGDNWGNDTNAFTVWIGLNLTFWMRNETTHTGQLRTTNGSVKYLNGQYEFNASTTEITLGSAGEDYIIVQFGEYQRFSFENDLVTSVNEDAYVFEWADIQKPIKVHDGYQDVADARVWIYKDINGTEYLVGGFYTNRNGEADEPVWLQSGEIYKFVITKDGYTTKSENRPIFTSSMITLTLERTITEIEWVRFGTDCPTQYNGSLTCLVYWIDGDTYNGENVTIYYSVNGGATATWTPTNVTSYGTYFGSIVGYMSVNISPTYHTWVIEAHIERERKRTWTFKYTGADYVIGEDIEPSDDEDRALMVMIMMVIAGALAGVAEQMIPRAGYPAFAIMALALNMLVGLMWVGAAVFVIVITLEASRRIL